ncbi:MAG: alanine--glyoxylate aminotransferase family protein [Desulfovibrionaceae bacterium]|nr:alanine--glyoxylate aminotransferase family protein [Desulfovibrionaceae bacterium]
MNAYDFAELTLFITGPISLRPEVRQAALLPEFGHRDSENLKRFVPIFRHLRTIAGLDGDGGYEVIVFNGSGTTVMEASIRSLVADGETVLNVSMGAFGDLYHKLAVANGKLAVQHRIPAGRTIDLAELDGLLEAHAPAVVTITHNETSTGVMSDIEGACALVRKHGALPLVDGVSIFGATDVRIAEARPAMYCTSTQKALGLPAGFGIAFVAREAEEKAAAVTNKGYASDLLAQLGRSRKHQTLTTPNGALANQMFVQLSYIVEEEGVAARFARHVALRDMAHAWVESRPDLELFAPEGFRSPTMTAVTAPQGSTPEKLRTFKEAMRTEGYLFDPGYGKVNDDLVAQGARPIFRIGHMGDMGLDTLERYLEVLGRRLDDLA